MSTENRTFADVFIGTAPIETRESSRSASEKPTEVDLAALMRKIKELEDKNNQLKWQMREPRSGVSEAGTDSVNEHVPTDHRTPPRASDNTSASTTQKRNENHHTQQSKSNPMSEYYRFKHTDPNAPRFDGSNVTEFLLSYEFGAETAGWDASTMKRLVPVYCSDKARDNVRFLSGFADTNVSWNEFKEELRTEFAGADDTQKKSTRAFIDSWLSAISIRPLPLQEYYLQFQKYTREAVARQQISEIERGWLFFKGLPHTDRQMVMFQMPENDRPVGGDVTTFDLYKINRYLRGVRKQQEAMSAIDPANTASMAYLARKDAEALSGAQPHTSVLGKMALPRGVVPAGPGKPAITVVLQTEEPDEEVKSICERMKGLVLSVSDYETWRNATEANRQLLGIPKNHAYAYRRIVVPGFHVERNDGSFQSSYNRTTNPNADRNADGTPKQVCYTCGSLEHRKPRCPLRLKLADNGWYHEIQNDKGFFDSYYGPARLKMEKFRTWQPRPQGDTQYRWLVKEITQYFNVDESKLEQPFNSVPGLQGNKAKTETNAASGNVNMNYANDRYEDEYETERRTIERALKFHESLTEEGRSLTHLPSGSGSVNAISTQRQGKKPTRVTGSRIGKTKLTTAKTKNYRNEMLLDPAIRISRTEQDNQQAIGNSYPSTGDLDVDIPDLPIIENPSQTESSQTITRESQPHSQSEEQSTKKAKKLTFTLPPTDDELTQLISSSHQNTLLAAILTSEAKVRVADMISNPELNQQMINIFQAKKSTFDSASGNVYMVTAKNEDWGMTETEIRNKALEIMNGRVTAVTHTANSQNALRQKLGKVRLRAPSPTCFVTVQGRLCEALIDTGAELNVLRFATARQLGIPIEEQDQSHLPIANRAGIVGANGAIEAYVGTAYNVPIQIGSVVIPTQFKVIRTIGRPMLLGTPWCAAASLELKFSPGGGCLCRVSSEDRDQVVSFMGVNEDHAVGDDDDGHWEVMKDIHAEINMIQHQPQEDPSDLSEEEEDEWEKMKDELMRRRTRQTMISRPQVMTLYKTVDKKVRPVDDPRSDNTPDLGKTDWRQRAIDRQQQRLQNVPRELDPLSDIFEYRYADFPRGTRLTPERLSAMNIGEQLYPNEKVLMVELMYHREGALAWSFSEMTTIHPDVIPPYQIPTILHKAWQVRGFQPPKKLVNQIHQMIRERIDRGTLEICDSQYRNPWFVVPKKTGDLRLINNAQTYNKYTIRDATLPTSADEFSERLAGRSIYSLFDLFSGYDQILLHPNSRDMTAFMTVCGLVRQCTLPQGATNSVGVFVRVINKILEQHFPDATPFIDDVAVGGPLSKYDEKEALPGVRRYVLEHIKKLDAVLADVERAGATVSGTKSYWGVDRMEIVGYEVDFEGRRPTEKKVEKILRWPECRSVTEVRQFIGICVYNRQWIFCFSLKAEPLFRLLKKDAEWVWGEEQRKSMQVLKEAITTAPALVPIDYTSGRELILGCDASNLGGGGILEQIGEDGKRHVIRFESTLWSETESKWHSSKLECKVVVWALKKFRLYIFNALFVIETDARTLIAQLNRSSTDLPGTVMNRWLGTILLHDFTIRHVPGKKNVIPDALSRYPQPEGWTPPKEPEDDLEPFINYTLDKHDDGAVFVGTENRILDEAYSEDSEEIARYLVRFDKPARLQGTLRRIWLKKAITFFVRNGHLFKKATRNLTARRVVDDPDMQAAVVWEVHEYLCHRGIQATYAAVQNRFWWVNQFPTVKRILRSCVECQTKQGNKTEEMLHVGNPKAMYDRWTIDITYMPNSHRGKSYLVVAREYLSGWVEARALSAATSDRVANFVYEDVICRWGAFSQLSVDGGPENKSVVEQLARHYGIHRIQASSYNSKAQGLIERGHRPLVVALAKLPGPWIKNLAAVLWADRVSVRRSTGFSAAELAMGCQPVMPIELSLESWQTLPWDEVKSTSDLLTLRAKQLEWKGEKLSEAAGRTRHQRIRAAEIWDESKGHRKDFKEGDMVLVWDAVRANDKSVQRKFDDRWRGPYKVLKVEPNGLSYRLMELDGAQFAHTTPANRIKPFHQRDPDEESELLRGRMKLYKEDMPIDNRRPEPRHTPPPKERVEEGIEERETRATMQRRKEKGQEVPTDRLRAPSPKVVIPRRRNIEAMWEEGSEEEEEEDTSDEEEEMVQPWDG